MSKMLKIGIIVLVLLSIFLAVITLIGYPLKGIVSGSPEQEAHSTPDYHADPDLIEAVKDALAGSKGRWEQFAYSIDHIQVQDDGQAAIVWLAATDPETGEWIDREPELALARLDDKGKWKILLEDEDQFSESFKGVQYAEKSIQGDLIEEDAALPKSSTVYGGYYLPWAAGLEKRLTWSVSHTSCYPTYYCTHAFDFADGTMFPLVAAKGGFVYHWKDTCANGDSSCTNSITLQDRSTTPWTYQIYLHIAKDSIPANLKKAGIPVVQGQYIADVDDTGYSTGHHVHFMVVSEATKYMSGKGYVWGVAEDITYRDVDINWDPGTQGGRPRLAYEAASYGGQGRTYYTSGNQPANPPTGGLNTPATKTYVTTKQFGVSGWGKDDIAIKKYEILAKYADEWVTVKEVSTTNKTFSSTVNVCDTSIPDGPFALALRVWDYEGNASVISSVRKLIKNVECGTAGSDPQVQISLNDGVLALPKTGFVNAEAIKGSAGSAIKSVEFWFHGLNWNKEKWVYLGKDSNGTNGWQAPITTIGKTESSNYIVLAVVTDIAGRQGADLSFNAIVDHTNPTITFESIGSPFMGSIVTFKWTGSDDRTGLDYYDIGVYRNGGSYQSLGTGLPGSKISHQLSVSKNQILVFQIIGYDRSGNSTKRMISVYTDGYVFPNGYIFPTFFNGD